MPTETPPKVRPEIDTLTKSFPSLSLHPELWHLGPRRNLKGPSHLPFLSPSAALIPFQEGGYPTPTTEGAWKKETIAEFTPVNQVTQQAVVLPGVGVGMGVTH